VKLEDSQHQSERLEDNLKEVTIQNELLSNRLEEIHIKYTAASSEIESLKSEIELLNHEDLTALKKMYMNKIEQMQQTQQLKEQILQQEIDRLKAIAFTKVTEPKVIRESIIKIQDQREAKKEEEEEEEEKAVKKGDLLSRSQLSMSNVSSASHVKYFDWESLLPQVSSISGSIVSEANSSLAPTTVQIVPKVTDLSTVLQGLQRQDLFDDSTQVTNEPVPIPEALRKSFEKDDQTTYGSSFDDLESTDRKKTQEEDEEEEPQEEPEDFMMNLKEFLHGFEQKRQQEEAKALQAQSALAAFEKHRHLHHSNTTGIKFR
jgi:hypothetical protein